MNRAVISIIVPTYNRAQWLAAALETLACQQTEGEFVYEIIVVDNASTDSTAAVVRQFAETAPAPTFYLRQETPGDAPTRNLGVEHSRGEWLAFFDDDQFAQPDWLLQLYKTALQTGSPVVGGAVHLDLPPEELSRLGKNCREALREIDYYDNIHPYTGKHLPGCGNALVARRVFDLIGLFDVGLVNGGSDSDFFLRARAAGCQLWYTPHAAIRHRVPPERLTPGYFRWDALQGGENTACFDYQRYGAAKLVMLSVARIGQALLVHLPLLLVSRLLEDKGEMLGWRSRLWRSEGYIRRTLSLLAPRLFPQKKFLDSLSFHNGCHEPSQ